ncbi:MAG: hypothetical protein MUD01_29090 [Chloroflexaceae bacterium]|jgi:hypothetical protein|nr:hypothetical protein [Chloroflexaceae bacterium]
MTAQIWMPEILQVLRKHSDSFACMQRIDAAVVELAQQAQLQGELAPHLDVPTVVRTFHALAQAPHIAPLSISGTPNPATIAPTLANIFRSGVQS